MAKKYYWLKLKTGFFENKAMKKLRRIAGGDTFTIIYLKMQLLSLKDEGVLYFEGIEDSFAEELALTIDEDTDNVNMTLAFLEKCGLLKVKSEVEYLLTEVPYLIGSETDKAEFMRKKRAKDKIISNGVTGLSNIVTKELPNVTNCYTEIEKEIDIELDKELEIDSTMSASADSKSRFDYQSVVELFNSICVSLPKIQKVTDLRKKKIKGASKELNGDFESLFKKVEKSDFLTGRNGAWNGCNFDWILKPSNLIKIIEGNYDNKGVSNNGANSSSCSTDDDFLKSLGDHI